MSTTVNGCAAPVARHDVDHVVTVLREHILALCAQSPHPPCIVRLSARDVTVEVEWPVAPAPSAPVAGAATEREVVVAEAEPAVRAKSAGAVPLCAETVGTFYWAPEPGATAFVGAGDTVRAGQQVGIIEAMKLMIPVEADRAGRVAEFLVDNGTMVEHGQPLLTLEPLP